MLTRYPGAQWRPIGTQSEPLIRPRILIFHTMVGSLKGSDGMFRQGGYDGTESHFGVGGPWDGADLDGVVWQWQSLDRQADAQGEGNAYCTSIETADGGNPDRPWSDKQLTALVALAAWWCEQTGAPARLVDSPAESGFGYHSQFTVWNPNRHSCPNPARARQLREQVIPLAAAELGATPEAPKVTPKAPPRAPLGVALRRALRHVSPMMHGPDVEAVQRATGTLVDGWYGRLTAAAVVRYQRANGLTPDGVVGPLTARAMRLPWDAA